MAGIPLATAPEPHAANRVLSNYENDNSCNIFVASLYYFVIVAHRSTGTAARIMTDPLKRHGRTGITSKAPCFPGFYVASMHVNIVNYFERGSHV